MVDGQARGVVPTGRTIVCCIPRRKNRSSGSLSDCPSVLQESPVRSKNITLELLKVYQSWAYHAHFLNAQNGNLTSRSLALAQYCHKCELQICS